MNASAIIGRIGVRRPVLPALAVALVLGGCALTDGPTTGSTLGATQFGASGSTPSSSVGTAKIEALLGAGFGRSLGPGDLDAAYQAQVQALELSRPGTSVTWSNPATGNHGEIVPGPTYLVNTTECRDFVHTVETNTGQEERRGTACRPAGGSWQAIA